MKWKACSMLEFYSLAFFWALVCKSGRRYIQVLLFPKILMLYTTQSMGCIVILKGMGWTLDVWKWVEASWMEVDTKTSYQQPSHHLEHSEETDGKATRSWPVTMVTLDLYSPQLPEVNFSSFSGPLMNWALCCRNTSSMALIKVCI